MRIDRAGHAGGEHRKVGRVAIGVEDDPPDEPLDIVGEEEVAAIKLGVGGPAVEIACEHGCADGAAVREERRDDGGRLERRALREGFGVFRLAGQSLVAGPPEVAASDGDVELFEVFPPDVTDIRDAGDGMEDEPIRVA